MTKHVKIYLKYFDLGEQDVISCEICGRQGRIDVGGFDIHHVNGRGKDRDVIGNLMALCRSCHIKAHNSVNKAVMQARHDEFLENNSKT